MIPTVNCSYTDCVCIWCSKTKNNWVNGYCSECGTEQYSEGLKYTLSSNGEYYTVTGIGTCTDTDIIIPRVYNDIPVTYIASEAFYYCTKLTSITIPNSVTSIGSYAFRGCTGLTRIAFTDTSTWYCTTKSSYTGGTETNVTNASTNATYFTSEYYNYFWYKVNA